MLTVVLWGITISFSVSSIVILMRSLTMLKQQIKKIPLQGSRSSENH